MLMKAPRSHWASSHCRSSRNSGFVASTFLNRAGSWRACSALRLISSGVPYLATTSRKSLITRVSGSSRTALISSNRSAGIFNNSRRSSFIFVLLHLTLQHPEQLVIFLIRHSKPIFRLWKVAFGNLFNVLVQPILDDLSGIGKHFRHARFEARIETEGIVVNQQLAVSVWPR